MTEIEAAIEAARRAGELLGSQQNRPHQVNFKGTIDIVTEMDRECERITVEILQQAFPNYGFLGEEGSRSASPSSSRWIIDPLDGTTNYSRGYPLYAVSIALEKQGVVVLGVVYNPGLDELFTAEKGLGARLNGQPIHVNQADLLGKSLVATGFPYDAWTNPDNNTREFSRFIRSTISVRCDGCASLDLCHTACGRLDGYWEYGLEPWDMAAGALIAQEAGGVVTTVDGQPFSHLQRGVLASNERLHPQMLELLLELQ